MKKLRTILTMILLWLGAAGAALAQQSSPNWSYGYTPTPAEWNHWFAVKTDWPGASSCLVTSCTMTGPIITAPTTALNAGLNIPPGVPPTTPNNGDVWTTLNGMFVRVNGATYNLIQTSLAPQGRLTLQANTPVMTTTQSAQTTLRYDCYVGGGVPYYDGTGDQVDIISPPYGTCEVTDAMVSAASAGQVVSGQVYDVWWAHGGANHICLAMSAASGGGGGWASDAGGSATARGTGYTQLDRVTRPYITNKNAIANCFNGANNYGTLLANQATYLGTVLATANGQITYQFGSAASGGGAGILSVWNMYNRVTTNTSVIDNGTTYTYTSNVIRQARASATNQVQLVTGLAEDGWNASYSTRITTTAAIGSLSAFGIGLDSTTAFPVNQASFIVAPTAAAFSAANSNVINGTAVIGLHTISANEQGDNTNANTFDVSGGATLSVSLRN
jgi:hypothetical protein